MRILLTGGSGFIGRHIAARLRSAHEVLAPTHVELDLADAEAVSRWLAAHRVDAVVHASIKPGHRNAPNRIGMAEQNLRQFFSLARCREDFGRFVVLGSGAAYGTHRPLVRVKETSLGEEVPIDEHGFSKYVEAIWLARDSDTVELRPFGVYGPGEDYAIRFLSNASCKALLGMPVTLRRDRLFSYTWAEDLAAVVGAALDDGRQRLAPGAYNVTPDEPASLRDLADVVVAASGRHVPVIVAEDGRGPEYSGDGTKLERAVPSLSFTRHTEGIERLLAWYADRLDQIDRRALETDR
jgi:UDP-glucose 4-epimerase